MLFLYWLSWPETVEARRIRYVFFVETSALMTFLLLFALDYIRLLPQRTHTDKSTDEVVSGKMAWHKLRMHDAILCLGKDAYYAPYLTKSRDRFLGRSGGDEKLASRVRGNAFPPGIRLYGLFLSHEICFGLRTVTGVGLFFFDLLMPESLFAKVKLYSSGR